jgi:hypothetical protein
MYSIKDLGLGSLFQVKIHLFSQGSLRQVTGLLMTPDGLGFPWVESGVFEA